MTSFDGISLNNVKFGHEYLSVFGHMLKEPMWLMMQGTTQSGQFYLYYKDNSYDTLGYWSSNLHYNNVANAWGITISPTSPSSPWTAHYSTMVYSATRIAKKINKLYGSVNGQTKLIFSD